MNIEELEAEYHSLYLEWCNWCKDWATSRLHAKDDTDWIQQFNGFERCAKILQSLDAAAKEIKEC